LLADELLTYATRATGVEPYTKAVAALFDPSVSRADLISTDIIGPDSITLRWRLEGKLRIGELTLDTTGFAVFCTQTLV